MIADDVVALGTTKRFEEEIPNLHSGWTDLTGATITFTLTNPNGIRTTASGSVDTTTLNLVYYDAAATVLNVEGEWFYYFVVNKSSVIETTLPQHFRVYDPRRG